MNSFSVLFIAAILAIASSAPNNNKNKVAFKYADKGEEKWQWQSIHFVEYNLEISLMGYLTNPIFDIFPYELNDPLRMQELVDVLDVSEGLANLCPAGNHWSILGFKVCDKDYIFGNPDARYFVFHYSFDGDEDGTGYALYNDCK